MSCPVRRRAICARWLLTRRMFRFFRKRRAETERPKNFFGKTSRRVMSRGLVFYENCAHRTGNCSYRLRSLSRPCGFCPETDRVQFRSLEAGRFVADCPRFIPCGVRRAMADMRKRLRPGFESICGIGISWLRLRSASGFRPARSLFLDRFPLSLSCRLLLFRYAVGPTLRCPYPEADRGFPGEVSEKRVRWHRPIAGGAPGTAGLADAG